jgi:uncharacterized membrane protein
MGADVGRFEWTLDWGPWGLGAALVVAVVVVALSWRTSAALPLSRRVVVRMLRLGAVFGLLFVLLQPTWIEVRPRADDRVVAVLLDASRSMAPGGKPTRWRSALDHGDQLAARVHTERFALSGLAVGALERHRGGPNSAPTDLLANVQRFIDGARPVGLTSVVVVSDGRDHGLLGHDTSEIGLEEALLGLGVPIHTIAVGDPSPLQDVVVGDVRVSSHALVRSPLPIELDIDLGAYAADAGTLKVVVELDGEAAASTELELRGPTTRRLRTAITPTTIGPHVVTVHALPLPNELTVSNNRIHVPINVLRDRTRVMHLAGHPSLDTRFLRAFLQQDSNVDLVSYYIMVGRGGGVFIDAEETTLVGFPTETLFGEALDDFDLVIFHDFAFAAFDIDRFIPSRLKPWLERGGAFLVIGGRQSFAAGAWEQTSIGPLLPLDMRGAGNDDGWRESTFAPRPTDVGLDHPVSRIRDDAAANAAAWADSRLPGHNARLTPRSGDAVLVEASDGTPLLALGERQRGRVAALATDGLWTWAFPHLDNRSRQDARADYRRLLLQLRGWLLQDPAYAAVHVTAPDYAVIPESEVVVDVRVRRVDQRAGSDTTVTLIDSLLPASDTPPRRFVAKADAQGRARFAFSSGAHGPHRLVAEVGGLLYPLRGKGVYAVAEGLPEDLDLRPDPASLSRLALAGGGAAVTLSEELTTDLLLGPHEQRQEHIRHALWSHPLIMLGLIALLFLEWALRRRWGLA